jgi:hypothetical protein
MKTQKFKVKIRGVKPLLMNAPNKIGEQKSKKQTNYDPAKEAEDLAYRNSDGMLFIPFMAILGTLRKSASNFRVPGKGRKTFKDFVYSGIQVYPSEVLMRLRWVRFLEPF